MINLNKIKNLPTVRAERVDFELFCSKGKVYVFSSQNFTNSDKYVKSLKKYTPSTNKWTRVTSMFDERHLFCGCAFINNIFIFGECFNNSNNHRLLTTGSCFEFNTK